METPRTMLVDGNAKNHACGWKRQDTRLILHLYSFLFYTDLSETSLVSLRAWRQQQNYHKNLQRTQYLLFYPNKMKKKNDEMTPGRIRVWLHTDNQFWIQTNDQVLVSERQPPPPPPDSELLLRLTALQKNRLADFTRVPTQTRYKRLHLIKTVL